MTKEEYSKTLDDACNETIKHLFSVYALDPSSEANARYMRGLKKTIALCEKLKLEYGQ
jgi:hypothetical protein